MLTELKKEFQTLKAWQWVSLALVVIGLILAVCFQTGKIKIPQAAAKDCEQVTTYQTVEIAIGDNFSPSQVSAHLCDRLKFTATDDAGHWPAAGPHPTHGSYPGFDAHRSLAKGESYMFTLNRTGEYTFHDHVHPEISGELNVK